MGNTAAHQTGIATLGDHRRAMGVTQRHYGRNLSR